MKIEQVLEKLNVAVGGGVKLKKHIKQKRAVVRSFLLQKVPQQW